MLCGRQFGVKHGQNQITLCSRISFIHLLLCIIMQVVVRPTTTPSGKAAAVQQEPLPIFNIAAIVVVLGALIYAFREGLALMVNWWERFPEYNHGYLIPVVAAYLLLLCADKFKAITPKRSWSGLLVVALGLMLLVLGELSAVYTIIQYGFLVTLTGVVITAIGWKATLIPGCARRSSASARWAASRAGWSPTPSTRSSARPRC